MGGYDNEISRVRARGEETSAAEAAKTLTILQEQLRIAKAMGEVGKSEAQIAQSQIDAFRATQGQARYEAAFQRRKNELAAAGDSAGVRAMEGYRERARLRDQYAAAGITKAQADSDFALQMRADARGGSRIVTDSIRQSVTMVASVARILPRWPAAMRSYCAASMPRRGASWRARRRRLTNGLRRSVGRSRGSRFAFQMLLMSEYDEHSNR